jgi:hypothetical protein
MDDEIREMLDHHQITKLLSVYCHGCDRLDPQRMASVYSQQSWDDHGVYCDTGQNFVERISRDMLANTKSVSHLLGQSMIHVMGNDAGAETYFIATVSETGKYGQDVLSQLGGRFVDKLIRENGQWRIKKRVVVRVWSVTINVDCDKICEQQLIEGQRSQADPSFEALHLRHSGLPRS